MRKFYLFTRALTSVVPFLNAKESLGTLCSPILNDGIRTGGQLTETALIRFHARAFTSKDEVELIARDGASALTQLADQTDEEFATYGVSLAVTNIAALFGYGSLDNVLRQLFDTALNKPTLAFRPSKQHGITSSFLLLDDQTLLNLEMPSSPVIQFCYHSFNTIVRRTPKDKKSLQFLLPFVHTMLVFLSSIETLKTHASSETADENSDRTIYSQVLDTLLSSMDQLLDWSALVAFLNLTASTYPITDDIKAFLIDGHPLLEDHMIRGLVWTQWYFRPKWFEERSEDDDGSRALETEANRKKEYRAAEVLTLGMGLAYHSRFLIYNPRVRRFSTADEVPAVIAAPAPNVDDMQSSTADAAGGESRSPSVDGGDSSPDIDGYVMLSESIPTVPSCPSPYVSGEGYRNASNDCNQGRLSSSQSLLKDKGKSKSSNDNNKIGKGLGQHRAYVAVKILDEDAIVYV